MSELEKMAEQKQYIEQAITALDVRINEMQTALKAFSSSIEAMKAINKEGASDILCHAGPSIMFRAKIVEPNAVFMVIGSDVIVEKSTEDAINDCEAKIKEAQTALNELANARYYNAAQLTALNRQLVEMANT